MSATVMLNVDQVDAILTECLKRGFWELGPGGQEPTDSDARREAASELVRQCRLHYEAGNRKEGILEVMFLADVDMSPTPKSKQEEKMAAQTPDLAQQSPDMLRKFEVTLMNYQPNETTTQAEIDENLAAVRAEMARRGMESSTATATSNGNAAPAPVAVTSEPAQDAPPVAVDAARKALEDRLTFPIMRAHDLDPSAVAKIPTHILEWMIANPDGPAGESHPTELVAQPDPPQPQPDGETVQTTRIVTDTKSDTPHATPPAASTAEKAMVPMTSEREQLEESVTGPTLKAYGRGRLDVPTIGTNELKFMLANPDGRVTQEELLAAKALDAGEPHQAESEQMVVAVAEGPPPESTSEVSPDDAFSPSAPPEVSQPRAVAVRPPAQETPSPSSAPPPRPLQELLSQIPPNAADEIIAREGLPLAPEIDDPPTIPPDMSVLSVPDLYSTHARFHACEARMFQIVSDEEDKVFDLERLLRGRDVEVRNALPLKENNVKLTDAQRDNRVAIDPEYREIEGALHDARKVVRKLKAVADGYHKTVERASRQMSRYVKEIQGAR